MSVVISYLIESHHRLVTESEAQVLKRDADAFRDFAENVRGSLVMNANKVNRLPLTFIGYLLNRISCSILI